MEPGVVQVAETADRLLARLAALTVHDRGVERRRRLCGWLAVACVPATLFFLISDSLGDRTRVAGAGAALAAVIALLARWRVYRRRDLDNRKIAGLEQLVRVLRADIRRDEPVRVTANLRPYTALAPLCTEGRITRYRDRWLLLAVRLADDNVLRLAVSDRVKRKQKRTRVVEKGRSAIALSLRLAKRYRPIEPIAAALRAGVPPPGLLLRQRQVTGAAREEAIVRVGLRTLATARAPMALADGDVVLHAIRWAYTAIAAAHRPA